MSQNNNSSKPQVKTYTDKYGNIHKYKGELTDYHNAELMCLITNEQQDKYICVFCNSKNIEECEDPYYFCNDCKEGKFTLSTFQTFG